MIDGNFELRRLLQKGFTRFGDLDRPVALDVLTHQIIEQRLAENGAPVDLLLILTGPEARKLRELVVLHLFRGLAEYEFDEGL